MAKMGRLTKLMQKFKGPRPQLSKAQKAGKTLGKLNQRFKMKTDKEVTERLKFNQKQREKAEKLSSKSSLKDRILSNSSYLKKAPGNVDDDTRVKLRVKAQTHRYEGTANGAKLQRPTTAGKMYIKERPDLVYPDKYGMTRNGEILNRKTMKPRLPMPSRAFTQAS